MMASFPAFFGHTKPFEVNGLVQTSNRMYGSALEVDTIDRLWHG
jgi:hypothetical protein